MTKKSLPDLLDAYSEFIQIGKLKLKSFGGVVINSGKWIYIDQNGWFVADKNLDTAPVRGSTICSFSGNTILEI